MASTTRSKKGLGAAMSSGLNKKKLAKRAQRSLGNRVILKDGSTVPVQFLTGIDGAKEYELHRFQEDGSWVMVPCLGEGCPLCDDESDTKSKTSYRFIMNVYNLAEKKVQVLEGPADLANKIVFKFERLKKPTDFTKRTWEVTRFPTNPTTYGMDKGEEDPVPTKGMKLIDLEGYVDGQIKTYYGDNLPTASALDGDDDDDDDADEDDADTWTEKELRKKKIAALRKIAEEEGVSKKDIKAAGDDKDDLIALIIGEDDDDDDDDEDDDDDDDDDEDDDDDDEDDDDDDEDDDEDDDDEDDDDDDEDDDDDDEPVKSKSKSKASKKSAPAKKSASKKKSKK
jgi:hypothetical protein